MKIAINMYTNENAPTGWFTYQLIFLHVVKKNYTRIY